MKITLDEISFEVYEQGSHDGLPVAFIHGFPFNHNMWQPQLRVLPERIRGIAYDIRGLGGSDVGDGQYTMDLYVDDLLAVLDHLRVERAVLCGLSMGGYIALGAMERNPERLNGLILCDTRSEADTDEGRLKRATTIQTLKTTGVDPFAEDFLKLVLAPETFSQKPELVQEVRDMIRGNPVTGMCGAQLAMASRLDTTPVLAGIKVPTLILVGEHDALTPPALAQEMASKIPGSRLAVIPAAGHLSNLENPEVFNDHLLAFLETI
jgi:3-oxoadipate enol-lactonase